MSLQNTTPVPNDFFDHIPYLSHAEIRVLLVVIRQTFGWKDIKTGNRKVRDRMTYDFIVRRTGLYRTIISETIQGLADKGLLLITDRDGTPLKTAMERKGKWFLFFQFQPVRFCDATYSESRTEPVRDSEHNKRNTSNKKLLQKENLKKLKKLQQPLLDKLKMNFE